MRCSIRYQLLFPLLVLLLGVIGLSTWLAVRSAQQAVRQQIEMQMRQIAHTLHEGRFPLTQKVLEQVKELSGADFLLVAHDGRVLSTLVQRPDPLPLSELQPQEWQDLQLGPAVSVGGQSFLCAKVRLERAAAEEGDVLYALYPEARWRQVFQQALQPSIALALIGGLGSLALALAIANWLTRRIQQLEARTGFIKKGDFRSAPVPAWDDELRDLALSVNDMATQLAHLQEAMRKAERHRVLGQVSGGLAHQLRNGAAGARLAVQLHAQQCATHGEPEALDVALRQLSLLEEKLQRFLRLGQEEGFERQPCSLNTLLDEAISLYRPQCKHLNIDLNWHPPADALVVLGDSSELGHLFTNVLGNAIEAVSSRGWIRVRAGFDDVHQALVEVVDSGPGPPTAIASQLFEEFVSSKEEGIGLGLAVARRVAVAHGGRIDWCRQGGHTCFRILLPVLDPGEKPPALQLGENR